MSNQHGNTVKAVIVALIGNLLVAISKFIVFIITSSTAILAESIHTFADCMNQVFLLIGNKRSKKQSNELHNFGYKKEAFFWSMLVAVLLFFMGAVFSIYEGIEKLIHKEPLTNIYWVFIVLAISIPIEYTSFRVALKEFRKTSRKKFLTAIEESTNSSLMVILLEDFGALIGLLIVLCSTILSLFNPVFDAIGSIFVGLLLLLISYKLGNEIRHLITGESIPKEKVNEITKIIKTNSIITNINDIKTMVIGNDAYMVLISIDIDDEAHGYDIENMIFDLKRHIKSVIPQIDIINIEIKDSLRNK